MSTFERNAEDARVDQLIAETKDFMARRSEGQAIAVYEGQWVFDYIPVLDQMRKEKRDDEALALLLRLIPVIERSMDVQKLGYPFGWYRRAGIIMRRQGDYEGEIAMLERYLEAQKSRGGNPDDILTRLEKSCQLLAKSQGSASLSP